MKIYLETKHNLQCQRQRLLAKLLVVLTLAAILLCYFRPFHTIVVIGDSMEPTYHSGQVLLVQRPQFPIPRGTIVTAHVGDDYIVKRIAYLSGDKIDLIRDTRDNTGTLIDKGNYPTCTQERGWERKTVVVPDKEVFLLGDNAPVSDDSRSFGPIKSDQITGVVISSL